MVVETWNDVPTTKSKKSPAMASGTLHHSFFLYYFPSLITTNATTFRYYIPRVIDRSLIDMLPFPKTP